MKHALKIKFDKTEMGQSPVLCNKFYTRRLLIPLCLLLSFLAGTKGQTAGTPVNTAVEKGLFDSEEMLTLRLRGNVRGLLKDRTGEPTDFPFEMECFAGDSRIATLNVYLRTRGHFRRMKGNCTYPPLYILFSKDSAQMGTLFREQKKMKLVMPCQGDEYVVREWLVYKIYNLLTPMSFKARLVQVVLEDSAKNKTAGPFYGMLQEEEKQMAARNNCLALEKEMKPEMVHPDVFLRMAVFEYLIGNTDWSVEYLQNIKLIAPDSSSLPVTVPYDFDHAGIVNAPYAKPFEALRMSSNRERRYRGYCMTDMNAFNDIIEKCKSVKEDVYKIYTSCPLLDARYVKSTIRYLDEFYAILDNSKAWKEAFRYPCDKNGTGNVIIKGMKKD